MTIYTGDLANSSKIRQRLFDCFKDKEIFTVKLHAESTSPQGKIYILSNDNSIYPDAITNFYVGRFGKANAKNLTKVKALNTADALNLIKAKLKKYIIIELSIPDNIIDNKGHVFAKAKNIKKEKLTDLSEAIARDELEELFK